MTCLCHTRLSTAGTYQRPFSAGERKEAAPPGGVGDAGGNKEGNYSLWDPPRPSHLLQLPLEIPLSSGRQLASSGPQPLEGTAEVGAAVLNAEQGGSGFPNLRDDLCGSGSGNNALWAGDVGKDTAHWEGFGRITPQGGPQDDGEKTSDKKGRWMGVSPSDGRNGRVGITGGGYLHLPIPEHSRTVHCNQEHYGPVSGGVAEAGVKFIHAVVGEVWIGLGGDADGSSGGRTDGGGGRDGRYGDELNWCGG